MLNNETKAWAKNFFYSSLGLQVPNQLPIPEDVVNNYYLQEFVKPVSTILYGEERESLEQEDVARFMAAMRGVKVSGIIHLIGCLVAKGYLAVASPLSLESNFQKCETEFLQDHVECYGACVGSKAFKCYTDSRGLLCGTFEKEVAVLGEVANFPKGLNLKVLMNQQPTKLNDFSVKALSVAVEKGIISKSDLAVQRYVVPCEGKFEEKLVSAVSPELPPFYVRKLINELPQATIDDCGNPYVAALEYAEAHPSDCRTALRMLNDIFNNIEKNEAEVAAEELNDDIVIEYLHNKYGTPMEDLRERLLVPTADKLYTSSYLLKEEQQNMSAEEFVEYATQNPMAVTGTLDEVLSAFCKAENFDMGDSVDNLIKFINDEPLSEKPSIHEQVRLFVEQYDIPQDCTLYEFITGEERPGGKAMEALNTLFEEALIDDGFFAMLSKCIKEKVKAVFPSLASMLNNVKMPDALRDAINHAAVTNDVVEVEKDITKEDVIDFLTRSGVPRVVAADVASGYYKEVDDVVQNSVVRYLTEQGIPEDMALSLSEGKYKNSGEIEHDNVVDYLISQGTPEDVAKAMADGTYIKQATSESRRRAGFDDKAYDAAEYLLYELRKGITSSDSYELRATYTPIIYSFMRVLMMAAGDEEDVAEFFATKSKDATPEVASYMKTAIDMLAVKN